jgi:hypothetical protein
VISKYKREYQIFPLMPAIQAEELLTNSHVTEAGESFVASMPSSSAIGEWFRKHFWSHFEGKDISMPLKISLVTDSIVDWTVRVLVIAFPVLLLLTTIIRYRCSKVTGSRVVLRILSTLEGTKRTCLVVVLAMQLISSGVYGFKLWMGGKIADDWPFALAVALSMIGWAAIMICTLRRRGQPLRRETVLCWSHFLVMIVGMVIYFLTVGKTVPVIDHAKTQFWSLIGQEEDVDENLTLARSVCKKMPYFIDTFLNTCEKLPLLYVAIAHARVSIACLSFFIVEIVSRMLNALI